VGDGGDDTLFGGIGRDRLLGVGGDDALNAKDGVRGNDRTNGGSDRDNCNTDARDERTSCEN
jgi:Ca2+-binding RTX toxin-like protein